MWEKKNTIEQNAVPSGFQLSGAGYIFLAGK